MLGTAFCFRMKKFKSWSKFGMFVEQAFFKSLNIRNGLERVGLCTFLQRIDQFGLLIWPTVFAAKQGTFYKDVLHVDVQGVGCAG